MNEIYDKLDEIKNNLDHLEVFNRLNKSIEKIKLNSELVEKIKNYNKNHDDSLRLDIYNYIEIKEYKKIENEINLLILQINQKLKAIKNKESCTNEDY